MSRDDSAYHLQKARSPGIDFALVDDTRAGLEAVDDGSAATAVDVDRCIDALEALLPIGRGRLPAALGTRCQRQRRARCGIV